MRKALLTAKEIVKTYPGAQEPVLNRINVEIHDGDFTVIMGPSGAGKSTLLYALSGMDTISSGQVLYKGKELGTLSEKKMAKLRASEFGFVFQQTHLVSNLTLFENVAVAGFLEKGKSEQDVRNRAEELLKRMNVEKAKNRLPAEASGGEAQRAAIARAMINRPGLLFADEPTGALNRKNSEEVLELLTALNRDGQSILMVTHDVKAAIRGTRILYLEDGKILDEMPLPPFDVKTAKEREEKVNAWLTALSW
ncbi:MAG TPA: ABC transporter ATP-binding protein [Candidatus Gallacutalibacter pullistercoris]|uniref:ABC transporter ATP-binding protein n=1 Tax=Candidatus Limivivens merdigallinarum TaxID=2840859 RepID=A0A9D0ZVZ6_9FIRM|nr:ABC transporter ATP-binding protein [Candidatus Limivivens merdigallinarum]HIS50003.1 ABC transporter ATP-binding protein [Candidatus Gallacutalibacter pullistercoris]